MLSLATVKSAGSAGNYYTDKDNYYVIGSMGERWAGEGLLNWGLKEKWTRKPSRRCWKAACRTDVISAVCRRVPTSIARAMT